MDKTEYFLSNPPCLSVPVPDADKLLDCDNLLCLKLYLYLLRTGKSVSAERAASDLGIGEADLKKTAKQLRSMGLLGTSGKGKVPPEQAIPEYGKSYLAKRSTEDSAFKSIQSEAAQILGHSLSAQELNTLFGIYDHLGLPPEVIYMLLNACRDEIQEKFGPGRLPTIRQIEQQAYIWANQEIMTYELAEEYLSRRRARKDIIGQLKHMMGIYDRTLTKTETDYLTDWLDKGFGYEAIAIAFDRTVTQTGGLKWAYMNKIMQSWHSKNLHTPEEIAAGDKPMSKKNSQPDRQPANNIAGGELERLKRIFGDM